MIDLFFIQTCGFYLHKTLIEWLESCGLLVDYCHVFISCLDSHSDGTHSLQRIHWWVSEETNAFTSWMAWVNFQQIFGRTLPLKGFWTFWSCCMASEDIVGSYSLVGSSIALRVAWVQVTTRGPFPSPLSTVYFFLTVCTVLSQKRKKKKMIQAI